MLNKKKNTINSFKKNIPEKDIQNAICHYLSVIGIPYSVTDASFPVTNTPTGKITARRKVSTPGWPDITAVLPGGHFLGIEVKNATGKLSTAQGRIHKTIREQGGDVIIARSVDDVIQTITKYNSKPTRLPALKEVERELLQPRRFYWYRPGTNTDGQQTYTRNAPCEIVNYWIRKPYGVAFPGNDKIFRLDELNGAFWGPIDFSDAVSLANELL